MCCGRNPWKCAENEDATEQMVVLRGSQMAIDSAIAAIVACTTAAVNDDDDVITDHMHIPVNKVGAFIGRQGVGIKEIARISGAQVHMQPSRQEVPNAVTKVCVIKGTPLQIHQAAQLIRIRTEEV